MGKRRVRPLTCIALFGALLTVAPGIHAAKEAVGESFEFEWQCPSEPFVPKTLSWPATLLVARGELGKVSAQGQRFKVIARIANGSYGDLKVTVKTSLLDGKGNVVATEAETDGTEEAEINVFSFRLELPQEEARAIEECRLELIGQPK